MYAQFMMDFEISSRDLKELLASGGKKGYVLLDVREPWEHEEARIEGSILMPTGDIPSRAHQELDPESRVIAICHHGVRSMSVVAWLRDQGFEQAQSLRGGIDAWAAEIDASVPRY
jgi:rhodanese-related sulfurtransferase